MEEPRLTIRLLIQKRRLALGITLQELAVRLQSLGVRCDHTSLSRLENNKRGVKLHELEKYAIALECRILDLIEESQKGL